MGDGDRGKMMGKKSKAVIIFFGVFLLYASTIPGNHTEAEDVFDYAWEIENHQVSELFYSSHLIYHPLMKVVFSAAEFCGYDGRVYPLMIGFSLLCGALTIALFYLLLSRISNVFTTGSVPISIFHLPLFLAFSYNFWRYSCEGEVYIPALAATVLSLWVIVRSDLSARRVVFGGVLAAFAVLMHIANAAFAIVAMPLYYLFRKRFKLAALHLVVTGLFLMTVFGGIALSCGFQKGSPLRNQPAEAGFQMANLARGGVAFGQCVASGNFLFASSRFRDWIQKEYPYRMLGEEVFMGEQASPLRFWSSSVTLLTLAIVLSALAFFVFKERRDVRNFFCRQSALLALLTVWMAVYVAVMLVLEPGNPEIWIMLLLPFWLGTSLLTASLMWIRSGRYLLYAGVIVLLAHNWLGGMAMIQDEHGDYNQQKADWVIKNAQKGDIVLTAENPVFYFYLRYYCDGEVINLNHLGKCASGELLQRVETAEGRVYALADTFDPPRALLEHFPEQRDKLSRFGAELLPHFRLLKDNRFDGVYEFNAMGR